MEEQRGSRLEVMNFQNEMAGKYPEAVSFALGCRAEDIVVTTGCQEAIELCVRHLCRHPDDVVLVSSPTYIGITGVAALHGIELWPVSSEEGGTLADVLASSIAACRAAGKQPRAFYVVSDFDDDRSDNAVRLAFSNATHAQIEEGVRRFARFVRDQLST
jgi:DNA-binding transcriptional MocR family regulator